MTSRKDDDGSGRARGRDAGGRMEATSGGQGMARPRPRPIGPPPAMVTVRFQVLPAEAAARATILVYDEPIQGGAQLLQVGHPTRVVVKAPGFVTDEREVTVAGETTITIELKKKR